MEMGAHLKAVLERHRATIRGASSLGVTLTGSFPEGGPINDAELLAINAAALDRAGMDFLEHVLSSNALGAFPGPAVIDVAKAAAAFNALGRPRDPDGIRTALMPARLRLQGTDGVRGPVCAAADGNPVLHFGRTGQITPALVRVLCLAFGRLWRRAGVARQNSSAVFAEDGRDASTGWLLSKAAKEGLRAAGLTVADLGTAPTPIVPFAQARTGAALGVALTSSHNPASQNGLKFFIDGFKMLPEGPMGDFALSALAYTVSHEGSGREEQGGLEDGAATRDAFVDYVAGNLPEGARELLRNLEIVFDPANGAYCEIGKRVFEKLDLRVTAVNDEPQGHNINEGGGVAEIEGRKRVDSGEAASARSLGSTKAVIEKARSTGKTVFGLVIDGDGDRGYVVVSTDGREAAVVDGDAEGFILATLWRTSGAIGDSEAPSYEFAGTVESDLELFRAVRERLGFGTRIGCVGDKWLTSGYRRGGKLAVAQEVSGHVLWPTKVVSADGRCADVLSGNGLLTGLSVVAAAVRLGMSPEEMAAPFEPGVFITRYTYNVDKSLFFPGSAAWRADLRSISEALDSESGAFDNWRVVPRDEDPDMLYVVLEKGQDAVGAVFARNSGTENKTCVYARGAKALEPLLSRLCRSLWESHRRTLKDAGSMEYRLETAALDVLEGGPLEEEEVIAKVSGLVGFDTPEGLVKSVLYGMRKEELAGYREGKLRRIA